MQDLASRVDQRSPWALPSRLAGLARADALPGLRGVATYGVGLTRFVVLPLSGRLASQAVRSAQSGGAVPLAVERGDALQVRAAGLLGAVVARGDDFLHTYLLAGTVTPPVLRAAVNELFADPPGFR